ncbi:hypothetical protein KUTeg_009083 [Tegillarca granosa]|uniref:C-type lectin domain-containing protein n=1 Tax=Tegillarca granosa TaxID=220873 RepID=A0ABQ9F7F5_TEGGR|nr:hypothetical protein KUTeg_009083 [Tegillarca granosa]
MTPKILSVLYQLRNHCKKLGNAYLATIDNLGHHDHWIGGSDYYVEGSWRWLKTGLGIKYFNWGPGQPSGTNLAEKDCIAIRNYNGTYMWSDEDYCHTQ